MDYPNRVSLLVRNNLLQSPMIETVIVCMLSMSPTVVDMDTYINCRSDENKIEVVEKWIPLIQSYFDTQAEQRKALKIIYCESRGNPNAVGVNTNGTKDIGLWQFNDDTWAWLKPKLNITSSRKNALVSTAVAKWLIVNDGWYHWNSSRHCWDN